MGKTQTQQDPIAQHVLVVLRLWQTEAIVPSVGMVPKRMLLVLIVRYALTALNRMLPARIARYVPVEFKPMQPDLIVHYALMGLKPIPLVPIAHFVPVEFKPMQPDQIVRNVLTTLKPMLPGPIVYFVRMAVKLSILIGRIVGYVPMVSRNQMLIHLIVQPALQTPNI